MGDPGRMAYKSLLQVQHMCAVRHNTPAVRHDTPITENRSISQSYLWFDVPVEDVEVMKVCHCLNNLHMVSSAQQHKRWAISHPLAALPAVPETCCESEDIP